MIWNPWRRIAELKRRMQAHEAHVAELQRALSISADRYDLVREMNLQLRSALELYRKS